MSASNLVFTEGIFSSKEMADLAPHVRGRVGWRWDPAKCQFEELVFVIPRGQTAGLWLPVNLHRDNTLSLRRTNIDYHAKHPNVLARRIYEKRCLKRGRDLHFVHLGEPLMDG
mgnify:FL=1